MATSTQWQYLERDPLSSQRQLSIKGRRIKARTLAGALFNAEEPRSVEQIAEDWSVPIEAVREAIVYVESKPIEQVAYRRGNGGADGPRSPRPSLVHSIEASRVFITHNFDDFEDLHDLVAAAGGSHPGILVVGKDNDSARDVSPRGIENTVRKLEDSGQTIENEYHILNQWR